MWKITDGLNKTAEANFLNLFLSFSDDDRVSHVPVIPLFVKIDIKYIERANFYCNSCKQFNRCKHFTDFSHKVNCVCVKDQEHSDL